MLGGRAGLASRLFLAQILVVLTGAVTATLLAVAVGPAIFHDHLHRVAGEVSPEAAAHVEQAYTSASAISLTVALFAAVVAALAASAYVARRVARPIAELADVAADVAAGNYAARAEPPGIGAEFDTVANAFNAMSARLAEVEATRRRLLADLGHELRTPLATIEAYLEAAEDGVAVEGEDTVSVLRTQTARLRRLAEDVAAVSRAEEHQLDLHRVRCGPDGLVRAAVAAARPRYDTKEVTLDERVAADLPDVSVDPERIGQVLANLLDNALRHTQAGGRVAVALDLDPAGVRITVSDTGSGIPAEHLPHVFERFYRADSARDRDHGGSGIGLAIAQALVQEHGGRITVASQGPGRGTTFTITLPAAAASVA